MKKILKYRFMTIPKKLAGDIRVTIDDRSPEYRSNYDSGETISLRLMPFITLSIVRPATQDDEGRTVRAPFNLNDSLGMTKFNLPIFIDNLGSIREAMKTPNLYTYQGQRLEINDKSAEVARRVFTIGSTVIEMIPVVIEIDESNKVEGIKVKFNNEGSSFTLTLNEMTSLYWNLNHIEIDDTAISMYKTYITSSSATTTINTPKQYQPIVDISPKSSFGDYLDE